MASNEAMVRNTKMKEGDITKEILKYLAERGHFAFKHHSGMMGRRGVSDIVGAKYPEGTAFFLEVKVGDGQASDEQRDFLFEAASAGSITGIVFGIDDVRKLGL